MCISPAMLGTYSWEYAFLKNFPIVQFLFWQYDKVNQDSRKMGMGKYHKQMSCTHTLEKHKDK